MNGRSAKGWGDGNGPVKLMQAEPTKEKDIAQPGVEPNVYDFVKDKVEPMPWVRNDKAYPANGSHENGWGSKTLAQDPARTETKTEDISDKSVAPYVYGFVHDNVPVLPSSGRAPSPGENGARIEGAPFALAEKNVNARDIGEPKYDYSVYHFARDNVETLPWSRVDEPYAANGGA